MKSVKISKTHVTTKYEAEDFEVFKNELFFYLLGKQKRLSFIPKLVSYDCSKLVICVENVGTTLEEYCNSGEELKTFLQQQKNSY